MKIKITAFLLIFFALKASALSSFQLHNINQAHAQGFTGKGVSVGVVDGGFYQNHPLLKEQIITLTKNVSGGYYASHGTHVAGIILASKTNGSSYGIASGAKFLGYGNIGVGVSNKDFDKMLAYDVRVINNSHNGYHPKFKEFANKGILIVYASANYSQLNPFTNTRRGTGSADNLGAWLVVGNINAGATARNNKGELIISANAVSSNKGNLCVGASAYCVMASGTGIYSLNSGGGYAWMSGTSMAAPAVSGMAALVAEKYPFLDGKQLADVILSTANKDFIIPKAVVKGAYVIYIDTPVPKKNGANDTEQIRADLAKVYNQKVANALNLSNVVSYSKEDIFGQGIVDVAKALKGLASIDINRLKESDVKNYAGKDTAFYTLDTKGHNALFENDIEQKNWDNKYHISTINNKLSAKMSALNAGFIKAGDGVLGVSGDLRYLGATIIRGGELHLQAKMSLQARNFSTLNIASDVFVEQKGALSTDTDVNMAGNLSNEGAINIGTTSINLVSVNGTYTQGQNATLKLSFSPDKGLNSALKAKRYDIQGGTLIYKPLVASALNRTIALNLQGLENYVGNFTHIEPDASAYALKYELSADYKSLSISASKDIYADFEGANESLAQILRQMSDKDLNEDYQNFFIALNSANFEGYKSILQGIDEKEHLKQNEQILLSQSANVLSNVLNLQNANTEWVLKPHYNNISSNQIKANRFGTSIYTNKFNSYGAFSAFLHYDALFSQAGQSMSSQSASLGAGARQKMRGFEVFGGASFGGAISSVEKETPLKYNALFASAFAGAQKHFKISGAKIAPTAFVSYHLFHQGKANEDKDLFARQISPSNSHFVSANAGFSASQMLNKTLNLGAYAFYERRILGKEIKSNAEFKDFAGEFTQEKALSADLARLGLSLDYEKKVKKRRFVRLGKKSRKAKQAKTKQIKTFYATKYFVSFGLQSEFSLNKDEYKSFGANLRLGVNF